MQDFTIEITGTLPLLMHSDRLANPLDPVAKAIKRLTSKRTKTDDDHVEIMRLEFIGSLYWHDGIPGPYLPGANIQKALREAGALSRLGAKVERGVYIRSEINPLAWGGRVSSPEELWDREELRHTVMARPSGQGRTLRTRPIFRTWSANAHGILDPSQLDLERLAEVAETAGTLIGLGDWRPRFGRFTATVAKAQSRKAA